MIRAFFVVILLSMSGILAVTGCEKPKYPACKTVSDCRNEEICKSGQCSKVVERKWRKGKM